MYQIFVSSINNFDKRYENNYDPFLINVQSCTISFKAQPEIEIFNDSKGQLILRGLFGFFNSPKKRTKKNLPQ